MAYRALAYRSRVVRFPSLSIRVVGPMSSFRHVTLHPPPPPLRFNGQNTPLVTVSPFSTTASHGRGGFNMEEAEERYAFDSENEAQLSRMQEVEESHAFDSENEAQFSHMQVEESHTIELEIEARYSYTKEVKESHAFDSENEAQFLHMQEAEESHAFDPENEAQFFQLGSDQRAEPAKPASGRKWTRFKRGWKGHSRGIDPNDTTEYPATSELAHKIMRETWGFNKFRPQQEKVISRLIHGGSAVIVFPTGGGKSLAFQIPALALDEHDESMGQEKGGISIVVSPLIALMKDQVDALQKRGVKAAAIDSTQTRESILNTYDLWRKGELKLLYCAPERLNNEAFVEMVRRTRVRLIAVDEAHCISEWGQAFRPDYLKVARFVKEMNAERVLCLTATATPKVCKDILKAFSVPGSGLFKFPTFRENLSLLAEHFETIEGKLAKLSDFLYSNPGSSIVYVTTQKQAEVVAQALTAVGVEAMHYHAGMTKDERSYVQDEFMNRKDLTIVATIAFGMGIDKPDIRNIVHYDFPRSLEGYSQEVGRAGRDGNESKCMLYLCGEDWVQREFFCRVDLPSKKSVNNLLRELFASNEGVEVGDVIEANTNQQSRDHDIKTNALNLLYSQLELRFGLLRAITPKYSTYRFVQSDGFASFTATDEDPITKVLLESMQKKSKRKSMTRSVDIDQLSQEHGIKREELVHRMQSFEAQGLIELNPGRVHQRYRILKPFPKDEADIQELIDKAYEQMEQREMDDLRRSESVIELFTRPGCIALGLAKHFGDEHSVKPEGCGKCQFCNTGEPLTMSKNLIKKSPLDPYRLEEVLKGCRVRDDPRLLAKVAFGISSPRIRMEKIGERNPIFGSMVDCDFDELMNEFAKHCTPEE
ncbi:P-loop containing nucleoside triphosphate hydrolase protein [Tuber indicum]|nr:P-loop containing nucleoside triphosphate hydrolase protein [Tuber indicum]